MLDARRPPRGRHLRFALCLAAAAAAAGLPGCKRAAPPTPPTTAPVTPPATARPADAGRTGAHRAAAAQAMLHMRQRQFDRDKAAEHRALMAFVAQTRAELDAAADKLKGKRDAARRLERLQATQQAAIAARTQALQALDPTGDRSRLTPDHETNLNFVADEYPAALIGALAGGDPQPIAELRAEMDRLRQQMEAWLAEVSGL